MSKSASAPAAAKAAPTSEKIEIRAAPIELTQLLKFAGLFDSGGEAKHAITRGEVTVNGEVEKAARKKISDGAIIGCAGRTLIVKSLTR
ncbi:MAG: RNA-binding S4 domain-containing protein [Verrucomicrobia bacterium]|nr:MAG: RNA-binding S4 domain-containing protein [Verrucomicrobiota bacterium]